MPRKPDTPCSGCGQMLWSGKTSAPADRRLCRDCRRTRRCGSAGGYRSGCRCEACREAKSAEMRTYFRRRLAQGVNIYHEYRATPTRSDWITPSDRAAIYERDRWKCQLCDSPVDPDLPPLDKWAATLDHINPRSLELIPDHSPSNLRLAHRSCNSRRGVSPVT